MSDDPEQPALDFTDRAVRLLSRIENAACPSCLRFVSQTMISTPEFKTYAVEKARLREWPAGLSPTNLETVKMMCSYCGYIREFGLEALKVGADAGSSDD